MGDCKFCGKSAEFLRSQHKECADAHDNAANSITHLCVNAALRGTDPDLLPQSIRQTAVAGYMDMSDSTLRQTLADGWRKAVDAAMEDHSLSTEEKRGLNRYRSKFKLDEVELDSSGHFELFRMMVLLNSLVEHGNIPRFDRRSARAQFGRLSFSLMKSEALVWVFNDVGYMEQVTRREFQGQSMGMSFRVAKGVYVRPGTFRGRAVESSSMERTDSGMLGLTTKHSYFSGRKSFRTAAAHSRPVASSRYGSASDESQTGWQAPRWSDLLEELPRLPWP